MKDQNKTYTLFCVPPNVTGNLHLGHAMMIAVQDTLVRWQRMQGMETTFLFGTDHAGISAQYVVEQKLKAEGMNRLDIGKEAFKQKMWEWVENYNPKILDQIKRLGASCDWSRNVMTLDQEYSHAVLTSFVRLYEEGLIYTGDYITNWCPTCQTSLSDLETSDRQIERELFTVHFPTEKSSIPVLTDDLAMIRGATALIVHSDYPAENLHALNPLTQEWIPLIRDSNVRNLGLLPKHSELAILCVPAHNPLHYDLAQTQELTARPVYNTFGKCIHETDLTRLAMSIRVDPSGKDEVKVSYCDRCSSEIIPLISKQWFIKMKPLAERLIPYIQSEEVVFHPTSSKKIALEWLSHIKDWCISRQIWWGHPLPVWNCPSCQHFMVQIEAPVCCSNCGAREMVPSEDVLDTWFSSAHWNFAYLGWPEKSTELLKKYPASLIETGRDILFFWVLRMMMLGLFHLNQIPSFEIFLHGLVLDHTGKKMSKSKGNTIDVVETLDTYGSDVLRYTLLFYCDPGRDIRISTHQFTEGEKLKHRLEALWQSFLETSSHPKNEGTIQPIDSWAFTTIAELQNKVSLHLQALDFKNYVRECEKAISSLYRYYVPWLSHAKYQPQLSLAMEQLLVCLHPLLPTTTEQLWAQIDTQQMNFKKLNPPHTEPLFDPVFSVIQLLNQIKGYVGGQTFSQLEIGMQAKQIDPFFTEYLKVFIKEIRFVERPTSIALPNEHTVLYVLNDKHLELKRLVPLAKNLLKDYSAKLKQMSNRQLNKQYLSHTSAEQINADSEKKMQLRTACDTLIKTIHSLENL